jgi:hypothetical protein
MNHQLAALIQACEMMRDTSSFWQRRHQHHVTEAMWSAWCKQVQIAKKALKENV